MLILSLDSAGASCSVCLWRDGTVLAQGRERMERGQDRRLMPLVMDVMQKAGVDFAALDRIAVTRGPGSFTGLRIGLAAARGIGLAAQKPVIGIDRFAVYRAATATSGKNLLIAIDSKRDELYCRFYPASGAPDEPVMMTPDEISAFLAKNKNTALAGDVRVNDAALQELEQGETVVCAALAARAEPGDPGFLPRPLYIRAPDVTIASRDKLTKKLNVRR